MKTLKIIIAVLLIVVLLMVTPLHYMEFMNGLDYYDNFFNANKVITPGIQEDAAYLQRINVLFHLIWIFTPLCILCGVITTFTNRKKYYCGFISAGLLTVPIVLCILKERVMNEFVSYLGVHRDALSEIWLMFSNGAEVTSALLLFLPTLVLLLSGIAETAAHFMKKKSRKTAAAAPVSVSTEWCAPVPSNASELKQYKELLDMGAITQEEFDAKKKQLLDLPNTYRTPTASQSVGKCVVCGCENVPLESIEVVVAGMSRKRTVCAQCAAKYK